MAASSSSSSSNTSRTFPSSKYDVFLSFRGADTRLNFTDHLYTALVEAGIETFRDDNSLPRGENIDQELLKAIHDSKCSVIVFSKDYASSKSCLYELQTILEHKKTSNHIVIPVFYDIDPSEVSNQTGSFMEAFSKHEKQFKEDINKVNRWREALKEAAQLAGLNSGNKPEANFVKEIINAVEMKLPMPLNVTPHLVGRDAELEYFNPLIRDGSISESIITGKLVSSLTKRGVKIPDAPEARGQLILAILRSKRVLIVVDELEEDDEECLQGIITISSVMCPGSAMVITIRHSRDSLNQWIKGVIARVDPLSVILGKFRYESYVVEKLDWTSSLQLFCRHAFGQDHPKEGLEQLSEMIVRHCEGNPLALKMAGFHDWTSTVVWDEAIELLKNIPQFWRPTSISEGYRELGKKVVKKLFQDFLDLFE